MKNTILLLFSLIIILNQFAIGQDSITIQDLEEFQYTFEIEDGQFKGVGGEILTKAIAESHITMLAENAGYKLEHHFTSTLINQLDKNNYKTMVLEVGGGAGTLISKMAKDNALTEQNIKKLNQKYLIEKKGRTFIPILELRSAEAIQTLENANSLGWKFMSLGIEPWSSYKLHIDELYNNLQAKNKKAFQQLYNEAISTLDDGYENIQAHNSDQVYTLISKIKASRGFTEFLEKAMISEANHEIIKALKQSIEFYWMYGNKEYHKKNLWSANNDKLKLKEDLKSNNFDFKQDKLFVKMWRKYLAKGMAPNGAYGVGNMLTEMADYHGSKSLSIALVSRFYKEDGELKDDLQRGDFFSNLYHEVIQLGKQNEWVLIDLRPFVKKFYYGNYIQSEGIFKMFSRYDMIIIPKTDEKATPNY